VGLYSCRAIGVIAVEKTTVGASTMKINLWYDGLKNGNKKGS
jgi:hypothetical protein